MERSLPPLVDGDVQATLIVAIDEIIWNNVQSLTDYIGDFQVSFLWWGDETPCELFPVNIMYGAVGLSQIEKTKLIFHVRTSASLFSEYLKSLSPLVLTITSVETNIVYGNTIIEDCSLILNTSKYYPILNNCVFVGDLKVHFEHVPNQILFYSDLKLNHLNLCKQLNAVKQNSKEYDVLEDVMRRGQKLRTAMLMSTLDFENEPRNKKPSEPLVSDPLIKKLLENPQAPDSLLHKYLLGEELTDLESDCVEQENKEDTSSEPMNEAVPEPTPPKQFTSLSLTLESARFTRAGLRKLKANRESNVPLRTTYYAELSCVGKRKQLIQLSGDQPARVSTTTVQGPDVMFNSTYYFKLPDHVTDGTYSLKHISIKLLYLNKVPVLLGSIEPLAELKSDDNGPQWGVVQPVLSNNKLLVGHLTVRLELGHSDDNLVHTKKTSSTDKSEPKVVSQAVSYTKARPRDANTEVRQLSKANGTSFPSSSKDKIHENDNRKKDIRMERQNGQGLSSLENGREAKMVSNIIKHTHEHIASAISSSDNVSSTANRVSTLNNYEYSLSVPYISGLAEASYIEYSFPECLTKPEGTVVHEKLVYTLELGGCRNLHMISLPPDISLARYLSDVPSSGIMFSLYSGRLLAAQSHLLFSQLLSMHEEGKQKLFLSLPTRFASEHASVQLVTLPMTVEYRCFQSSPQESAGIAEFWRRTCSLSKQFNTEQLTHTLDTFESRQQPHTLDTFESRQQPHTADFYQFDSKQQTQSMVNSHFDSNDHTETVGHHVDQIRTGYNQPGNLNIYGNQHDFRVNSHNRNDLRRNDNRSDEVFDTVRNHRPNDVRDTTRNKQRENDSRNNQFQPFDERYNRYNDSKSNSANHLRRTFSNDNDLNEELNVQFKDFDTWNNRSSSQTRYGERFNDFENVESHVYDSLVKRSTNVRMNDDFGNANSNLDRFIDERHNHRADIRNICKNSKTYNQCGISHKQENVNDRRRNINETEDRRTIHSCENRRTNPSHIVHDNHVPPYHDARYREGIDRYKTWQTIPEHMCEKPGISDGLVYERRGDDDVVFERQTMKGQRFFDRQTIKDDRLFDKQLEQTKDQRMLEKRANNDRMFDRQAYNDSYEMSVADHEKNPIGWNESIINSNKYPTECNGRLPMNLQERRMAEDVRRQFLKERYEAMQPRQDRYEEELSDEENENRGMNFNQREQYIDNTSQRAQYYQENGHQISCNQPIKNRPQISSDSKLPDPSLRFYNENISFPTNVAQNSQAQLNEYKPFPPRSNAGSDLRKVFRNDEPRSNLRTDHKVNTEKISSNFPHESNSSNSIHNASAKSEHFHENDSSRANMRPNSQRNTEHLNGNDSKAYSNSSKPPPAPVKRPLAREAMVLPKCNVNDTARFPTDYKFQGANPNTLSKKIDKFHKNSSSVQTKQESTIKKTSEPHSSTRPRKEISSQKSPESSNLKSKKEGPKFSKFHRRGTDLKSKAVGDLNTCTNLGSKQGTLEDPLSHGEPISLTSGLEDLKPGDLPQEVEVKKYFASSKEEYEQLLNIHRKHRFWKLIEAQQERQQESHAKCNSPTQFPGKQSGDGYNLCNLCTLNSRGYTTDHDCFKTKDIERSQKKCDFVQDKHKTKEYSEDNHDSYRYDDKLKEKLMNYETNLGSQDRNVDCLEARTIDMKQANDKCNSKTEIEHQSICNQYPSCDIGENNTNLTFDKINSMNQYQNMNSSANSFQNHSTFELNSGSLVTSSRDSSSYLPSNSLEKQSLESDSYTTLNSSDLPRKLSTIAEVTSRELTTDAEETVGKSESRQGFELVDKFKNDGLEKVTYGYLTINGGIEKTLSMGDMYQYSRNDNTENITVEDEAKSTRNLEIKPELKDIISKTKEQEFELRTCTKTLSEDFDFRDFSKTIESEFNPREVSETIEQTVEFRDVSQHLTQGGNTFEDGNISCSNRSVRSLNDFELKDISDESLKDFVAQYVIRDDSNESIVTSSRANQVTSETDELKQVSKCAVGLTDQSDSHRLSGKIDNLNKILSREFSEAKDMSEKRLSFEEILEEIYKECKVSKGCAVDCEKNDVHSARSQTKSECDNLNLSNMNSHQSLPNTSNSAKQSKGPSGQNQSKMSQERSNVASSKMSREEINLPSSKLHEECNIPSIGNNNHEQDSNNSDHDTANRNTISEINTSDELTCDNNMNNAFALDINDDVAAGNSHDLPTEKDRNSDTQSTSKTASHKSSTREQIDEIIAEIVKENERLTNSCKSMSEKSNSVSGVEQNSTKRNDNQIESIYNKEYIHDNNLNNNSNNNINGREIGNDSRIEIEKCQGNTRQSDSRSSEKCNAKFGNNNDSVKTILNANPTRNAKEDIRNGSQNTSKSSNDASIVEITTHSNQSSNYTLRHPSYHSHNDIDDANLKLIHNNRGNLTNFGRSYHAQDHRIRNEEKLSYNRTNDVTTIDLTEDIRGQLSHLEINQEQKNQSSLSRSQSNTNSSQSNTNSRQSKQDCNNRGDMRKNTKTKQFKGIENETNQNRSQNNVGSRKDDDLSEIYFENGRTMSTQSIRVVENQRSDLSQTMKPQSNTQSDNNPGLNDTARVKSRESKDVKRINIKGNYSLVKPRLETNKLTYNDIKNNIKAVISDMEEISESSVVKQQNDVIVEVTRRSDESNLNIKCGSEKNTHYDNSNGTEGNLNRTFEIDDGSEDGIEDLQDQENGIEIIDDCLEDQRHEVELIEDSLENKPLDQIGNDSIIIVDEMKRNDFVLVKDVDDGKSVEAGFNDVLDVGNQSTYWKYNDMDSTLVKNIQQHAGDSGGPTVSPSPFHVSTGMGHFNVYNRTHYGASLQNNTIFTNIKIKQAQNLPLVIQEGKQVPPTTYVTIENIQNDKQYVWMSPVVIRSVSPIYDVRLTTKIPTALLYEESSHLILVVWYKPRPGDFSGRDSSADLVLGYVRISLGPLLTGLPSIRGWHNIVNFSSRICGQLKVSVEPLERIEIEESIVLKVVPEVPARGALSASCSLCDLKTSVDKIDEKISKMNDVIMECVHAKYQTRTPDLGDARETAMTRNEGKIDSSMLANETRSFVCDHANHGPDSVLASSLNGRLNAKFATHATGKSNPMFVPCNKPGYNSNFVTNIASRPKSKLVSHNDFRTEEDGQRIESVDEFSSRTKSNAALTSNNASTVRDYVSKKGTCQAEGAYQNREIQNSLHSKDTQTESRVHKHYTHAEHTTCRDQCRHKPIDHVTSCQVERDRRGKDENEIIDKIEDKSYFSSDQIRKDNNRPFSSDQSRPKSQNENQLSKRDNGRSREFEKPGGMSKDFAELRTCLENLNMPKNSDEDAKTYTVPSLSSSSSSSWSSLLKSNEVRETQPNLKSQPSPAERRRYHCLDEIQNFDLERINKIFRSQKNNEMS